MSIDTAQPDVWRGVVDALAVGVAVIDDEWRIAYTNPAAAATLASDPALTAESGVMVIRPGSMQERVRAWLHDGTHGRLAVAVPRASGRPPVLLEYLSRINGSVGIAGHLIALLDTARPPAVDASRLMAAFGLTPAEARLTAALAAGETLQGYASSQGVAVATLRTHLESVYAKTGVRRQAQLVRLAMGCAVPCLTTTRTAATAAARVAHPEAPENDGVDPTDIRHRSRFSSA
jgi:DNA-binding CsgD family transcriptional regulator